MVSLTRHLHSFIRDVRLTEEEWDAAINFLTACGHMLRVAVFGGGGVAAGDAAGFPLAS